VGAGWRGAGRPPARGVESRACLKRQRRPPPSLDCPRTKPGLLECLPCATVGHRLGGGREAGGGRRGLPLTRPASPQQLLGPHPCLLSTWTELWGILGALQMQIRVAVRVGARLHAPAAALRSHFCARATAPAGPCCTYFLLRGFVYAS